MQTFDLTKAKPLPPFKRELREAIRQGRKTQTRRLITKLSEWPHKGATHSYSTGRSSWTTNVERHDIFDKDNNFVRSETKVIPVEQWALQFAPYQPGDIVYLKEPLRRLLDSSPASGYEGPLSPVAFYKDDDTPVYHNHRKLPWRWKVHHLTSIQFPREAARWFGRIKSVRVERVQEISGRDARAEGCEPDWDAFEEATFDMEGWEEPEEFAEECDEECDWVNFGNDLVHAREHREWLRDRQEYALQLAFRSIFDACHPGAWERNEFVWVYKWEAVNAN